MHATDFLKKPTDHAPGPVAAVYGPERHLKHDVILSLVKTIVGDGDDDDLNVSRFTGKEADLATVCDELRTISMWGNQRVVIIDDADEFVTKSRVGLEKYVESPGKNSLLVLDVRSWPKNTKLAKKVAKSGIDIECSELKGAALYRWLTDLSRDKYEKQLGREAAALMVELAGASLGLLDQEVAKLASYVGDREKIEPEDVQMLVGGWKAETTWTMLNAVRDGDMNTAFECLDKLFVAGEAPQKMLGGINFVFRKFAHATEHARQGKRLGDALRKGGVFPRDVELSERYLRRVGRPTAEHILNTLLTADGNLKGGSRVPDRLQMERLLISLGGFDKPA